MTPASPRRLLVLDDDELVGVLVETVGGLAGLETRLTFDPEIFFATFEAWRPDVVFVDLTMPKMSGEDVLRGLALRQCSARIIVSSGSEPGRLAAAAALACRSGLTVAGSLPKPFSPATLRGLLNG